MLVLQTIAAVSEQRKIFSRFDPSRTTWLVSDLKSKLDLNRSLLKSRDFLPGDAILRVSEFWKMLLTRTRPDLQTVSREFAITVIGDLLHQEGQRTGQEWVQAPGAAQATYETITQLMPILSHPDGRELIEDWFEKNPQSATRWRHWFEISRQVWGAFLEDGFIAPQWIAGVLINELNLRDVWRKSLVVDLGAQLNAVEADALILLSESVDITVLQPHPAWLDEYPRALRAYRVFERKQGLTRAASEPASKGRAPFKPVVYKKFTTMIAEVKDAVAQIREWLDLEAKLEPQDIAIVAPDIEQYWPALCPYLREEGIPVQKNEVDRAHSFPDIARWLARLRLRTGAASEADLELAVFSEKGVEEAAPLTYERFKVLYSTIYGPEDLGRDARIARLFRLELKADEPSSRDDFIAWSLRHLPNAVASERVEGIFKRVFAECPISMVLPVHRWLSYLVQIASKSECVLREGDAAGIAVVNLASAENLPAKKMIVLGLNESAMREARKGTLTASDLQSLEFEYGFNLSSEDQARAEFQARWIAEDLEREVLLFFAETDFDGNTQAPSWLWMRGARAANSHDQLSLPRETRWDEIQKMELAQMAENRKWMPAHFHRLESTIATDLGESASDDFGARMTEALSPSGIEDYLDCPFSYAAKRLFRLSDQAELDLEVDASRRGSLMHAVFELLTAEPFRANYSDDELVNVVDQARTKAEIELADERMWPPLRARYVDLARRFVAFEAEYRTRFPQVKTVAREFLIKGELDVETGRLVPPSSTAFEKNPSTRLKFSGRIDRVDADAQGNLAIFDYKSSAAAAKQFGAWLKNNQIQLLLYASAIENGLTELQPKPVAAALYYVSRPLARDNGFMVTDMPQSLYESTDRKKNKLTKAEKSSLFEQGQTLLREVASGVVAGRFPAQPRDVQICITCRWSSLCRAPHLNV